MCPLRKPGHFHRRNPFRNSRLSSTRPRRLSAKKAPAAPVSPSAAGGRVQQKRPRQRWCATGGLPLSTAGPAVHMYRLTDSHNRVRMRTADAGLAVRGRAGANRLVGSARPGRDPRRYRCWSDRFRVVRRSVSPTPARSFPPDSRLCHRFRVGRHRSGSGVGRSRAPHQEIPPPWNSLTKNLKNPLKQLRAGRCGEASERTLAGRHGHTTCRVLRLWGSG